MRIVPAARAGRWGTSLMARSSATAVERVDSTRSASAPSRQPYGRGACAGHRPGSVGVVRAAAAAIAALAAGVYVAIRRLLPDIPDWVRVLRRADDSTSMDPRTGAVRSVQSAEVVLPTDRIDSLWSPLYLERLPRAARADVLALPVARVARPRARALQRPRTHGVPALPAAAAADVPRARVRDG